MARTNEGITDAEIKTYQNFCADNNIVADESEAGLQNGNEIGTYVAITWGVDLTPTTLAVALDKLRDRIIFYTPAQAEYNRVAAANPVAATTFMSWFENQKQLVNTGDPGFQNAANILAELGGRNINSKTIHEAIGRIEAPTSRFDTRKRPPLHYVSVPSKQDPRQHQSDGTGFLGKTVNEPRWKRLQREREEREAAERAKQPGAAALAASAAAEAKHKATSIKGATHAETEEIGRVFVTAGTEIDWPATLQARLTLQKSFNRAQEVRRFVR